MSKQSMPILPSDVGMQMTDLNAGRTSPRPLPETLEAAVAEIQNDVFAGTQLLERLADVRIIRGNGHHIRQEAARLVGELLKERWNEALGDTAEYDTLPE